MGVTNYNIVVLNNAYIWRPPMLGFVFGVKFYPPRATLLRGVQGI